MTPLKKKILIGLISILLITALIFYNLYIIYIYSEGESIDNESHSTLTEIPEEPDLTQYLAKGIRLTFIHDFNDSIVISWFTEKNTTDPMILYSKNSTLIEAKIVIPNSTKISDSTFFYTAEITELFPNTTYYYQISSDINNKRGIMNFTTVANENSSILRFIVYGDSRTQRLERTLLAENIKSFFGDKFDFTIHTGDIVDDGTIQSRWDDYFMDTESLNAYKPGIYVEGNHEGGLQTKMYDNLPMLNTKNNRYCYFSYGKIGFIILNSNNDSDESQTNWLNLTLMELSNKNIYNFVFMHHPLLHDRSFSYHREKWRPLFEKYNTTFIICGHNHHYERSYPIINTTTSIEFDDSELYNYTNLYNPIYIVSGGAGAPLYNTYNYNFTAYTSKIYHFLLIKIKKGDTKSTISLETWGTLDNFSNLSLFDNITITKSS